MVRKLNIPLLIATLVLLAIGAPAAYFWHAYQLDSTAETFLVRAETLESEKDFGTAAQYYHRYLRLRPDDVEARIRLAQTFDKTPNSQSKLSRSIDLHYRALGAAPPDSNFDLRARLVELLLEARRFSEAETEALALARDPAHEADSKRLLAIAMYGQYRSGTLLGSPGEGIALGEAFEQAIAANPSHYELAFTLAELIREFENQAISADQIDRLELRTVAGRATAADALVDRAVKQNPEVAEAYLARYQYRLRHGDGSKAAGDLDEALRLGADNIAVRLSVAQDAFDRARDPGHDEQTKTQLLAKAEENYRFVLAELSETNSFAHLGLGDVLQEKENPEAAIEAWRKGLEQAGQNDLAFRTRIARTLVLNNETEEAEKELATIRQTIEELTPFISARDRLSIERTYQIIFAHLQLRTGNPASVISLLSQTTQIDRNNLTNDSQYQALMLLGAAYDASRQWDQAALAYQEAASIAPQDPTPRLAAALAWYKLQRPEMAVQHVQNALALESSPEALLLLAQSRFQLQVRLPGVQRDWKQVDATVERLKQLDSDSLPWRVILLEADLAIVREPRTAEEAKAIRQKAIDALTSVADQHREDPEFLQSLAVLHESVGQPEAAENVLAASSSDTESKIIRAEMFTRRGDYVAARAVLENALESAESFKQPGIIRRLVELHRSSSNPIATKKHLEQLHQRFPSDTTVLLQLADAALAARDLAEAEAWERKLESVEGSNGTLWRYVKVRRLLAASSDPHDARYREAADEQSRIEKIRPAWPVSHLLRAQLAEGRSDFPEAVEAYRRAIDLGDQRIAIYERLVDLLYRQGRFGEASEVLASLQDSATQSQSLTNMAMSLALEKKELGEAEQVALMGLQRRPTDPMSHIWYGQVLLLADKTEEAHKSFQQAVEIAGKDARAWNGLFGFYLRTDNLAAARETLEKMKSKADLPAAELAFFTAQGYEALGDRDLAEAAYQKACELAPQNPTMHFRRAQFYLARDNKKAEESLREVLLLEPDHGPTRRLLATILATRGGDAAWAEAQQILADTTAAGEAVGANRQLQAILLTRRGNQKDLDQACAILEELVESPQVTDNDRLLLAQLYIRQSRLPTIADRDREARVKAADQLFVELVARQDPAAQHLMAYLDFLLDQGQTDKAVHWLNKLEQVSDDALTALELRVRWLVAQAEQDQVVPLVQRVAQEVLQPLEDQEKRSRVALVIGRIYAKHGFPEQAETWHRKFTEANPEGFMLVAQSLAARDQLDDAVQVCLDAAEQNDTAQPAIAAASILLNPAATDELVQSCEELIESAMRKHPDDVQLLMAVANLRISRGQLDQAISIYRKVLELRPNDMMALNNQATLLAETSDGRAEALELIDRAIQLGGAKAPLFDTKGMIQLQEGNLDEAVRLLEYAVATSNPDPRYHFHLAAAYERRNNDSLARIQLQKALELDLDRQLLTESDLTILSELKQSLLQ